MFYLTRSKKNIIRICGLLVASIGIVALLGWFFEIPLFISYGSNKVPMAPSTALLFTLYGISFFLRLLPQGTLRLLGSAIHIIGPFSALLVGYLNYHGYNTEFEHLGFRVPEQIAGATHVGHISPLTGFCFALSSISYLLSLNLTERKRRQANFAWLFSIILLMISYVLLLAYLLRMPLLYGSAVVPPALPTSIAFHLVGIALFILAWPYLLEDVGNGKLPARSTHILIITFLALTTGILTAGTLIYRSHAEQYRSQVEQELTSIAKLKVTEIEQWRHERLQDARIIFGNDIFHKIMGAFLKNPENKEAEKTADKWLRQYSQHGLIEQIRVLNKKQIVVKSLPPGAKTAATEALRQLPKSLQSKRVTLVDFYRDESDQRIYLSLLIPVLDLPEKQQILGAVSLKLNPERYLYPFILRWPTPSKTAETILVRREDDQVLVLNELRFQKNSALTLRIPLSQTNDPAVLSVLGKTGIVEGVSFPKNVTVIADVRAIPNTPWFLVTQMDTTEVYGLSWLNLWTIAGFVVALILSSGALLALAWRKQALDFYRREHKAQEALKESENRIKFVGNNMPNAMLYQAVVYPDGTRKLTFLSDAVRRFYGCSPEEAILDPTKIYGRIYIEDQQRLKEEEDAAIKELKTFHSEVRVVNPSGTLRWSHFASSPRRLTQELTIWDGIEFDITKSKEAEAELVAAKRAAEEAARSKSKFLDIAAHELRNPVTAFSLLLQLFRKQTEEGRPLTSAEFARLMGPAERLTHLVSDLLDVSRLDRGILVLRRSNFDLTSLVEKCLEEFQLQAPKRRFNLIKSERQVEVNADPLRINQVISNLIDNAIKYTPESSDIDVKIESVPRNVRVSVIDHGPGITDEQRQNLFTPFSRKSSDVTPRAGGLGLGLSVCRGIIDLHGGKIDVLSETGRGSTFFFELPTKT